MVCNFETIFNYYNNDDMLMQIHLLKDKKTTTFNFNRTSSSETGKHVKYTKSIKQPK